MDTFAQPKPVRLTLPGYRHLLLFFIPLALSSSMMTLEPLIINTTLSHGSNSEVALAAYSVMFSISLLIEAPVIMLVSASTALSRTRDSFRLLFRFMLILGIGSTTIGFLVALTPLYDWLVLDLMHIPPAVAEVARPALVIMAIWSLPVAWRRTLQGVLIAHDRTPIVTLATIVRLLALFAALSIGRQLAPDRMLMVSAAAMQVSVISEALIVTGPAFRIAKSMPAGPDVQPLTWRSLIHFYQPLAITMILRQITQPLLNAGIAAAQLPQLSLAAWSVSWSLVVLPFGVTMGLEQVAIAKGTTPAALGKVRRFSWGVGLFLSTLLVLIAFTPLVHPVLGTLFDLTAEIEPLVIEAIRWLALLPLLQSLQALLRGIAIDQDRTSDVRAAVAIGLVATLLVTVLGPKVSMCTGIIIGTVTTMTVALAEVGWLAWRERRA